MRSKKNIIVLLFFGILLLIWLYCYQKSYEYRVQLIFINKTGEKIDQLRLSYTGCEKDLTVPAVSDNKKETTFRPKIIFNHDVYYMDIWIYYKDSDGQIHKKKIIKDYASKPRVSVKCIITIESINENGVIELTCQ